MGGAFTILRASVWGWFVTLLLLCTLVPRPLSAAPEAAFVMDARTGEVLLAQNADTPLHPASLTKMMTLYVAFAALEAGEVFWDAPVRISEAAASVGGSSMSLQPGQQVALGDLVRATAVKSANDAAFALAEAVAGGHPAFVNRMNATATAMGLRGTTFRNSHGLTAEGHLSTARDMSVLGWRLLWDFPSHAGLYATISADIAARRVAHTNRRFLNAYSGANGIKTGYTRAAGFTLTASATRGRKHLIATVFGAPSSEARAARTSRLMDWGFARIAEDVSPRPPPPLVAPDPGLGEERAPPLLMAAAPLATARSAQPLRAGVGASGMGSGASAFASAAVPLMRPNEQVAQRGGLGGMALSALTVQSPVKGAADPHGAGVPPPAMLLDDQF